MSQLPIDFNGFVVTHLDSARNELTGQVTVMDRIDRIRHDKFCAGIIECLKPADALEIQLAQSIAEDYWRLNRIRCIEEGIFSICHPDPSGDIGHTTMQHDIALSQTRAFLWKQADFKFLNQYEMRIQRMLNRNKAELKQLQAERRAQPANDSPINDSPINDSSINDGFAFSNHAEIPETAPGDAPTGPLCAPEHTKTRTAANANGFEFSNFASSPSPAPQEFVFSIPPAAARTPGQDGLTPCRIE